MRKIILSINLLQKLVNAIGLNVSYEPAFLLGFLIGIIREHFHSRWRLLFYEALKISKRDSFPLELRLPMIIIGPGNLNESRVF